MKIDEIQLMWESDCGIDDNYLGEAATFTPKLHSKYIKLVVEAKLKLSKLNSDYNTLRKTKFRYYRGEMSKIELAEVGWDQWQGIKPLKGEMDEILTGDTDLNTINLKIEYLGSMIYLLESILGQIRSRDFQIKNGIAWKQFLAGM